MKTIQVLGRTIPQEEHPLFEIYASNDPYGPAISASYVPKTEEHQYRNIHFPGREEHWIVGVSLKGGRWLYGKGLTIEAAEEDLKQTCSKLRSYSQALCGELDLKP